MKKKRRNPELRPTKAESKQLYFRLCHLCFFLNEATAEIEECRHCQHGFKDESLKQFFDNDDAEAFSDKLEEPKRTLLDEINDGSGRMAPRRMMGGIYGLSVVF